MKILNDLSYLKTTVKENITTKSKVIGYLKRKNITPYSIKDILLHRMCHLKSAWAQTWTTCLVTLQQYHVRINVKIGKLLWRPCIKLFHSVLLGAYPYLAIFKKYEIPVAPLPAISNLSFSRDIMVIFLCKEILKNK